MAYYPKGLAKAMEEYPSRWDFSQWNCLAEMALRPEDRNEIHEDGIKLRRRAWEIVAQAKEHRDTVDHSHEQVKEAHGKGAPAQRSAAQPSSSASLVKHGSSEMSGEMPIREPLTVQDEGLVVDEQGTTSQAQELIFMEDTTQQKGVVE